MKEEQEGWVCQGGVWVFKEKPKEIVVVGFKPATQEAKNETAETVKA
jgi:hypothetical protein